MNQQARRHYLTLLTAKQFELSAASGKREDIVIEKVPDAVDDAQLAADRELAIRNLNRESALLRNLRAALRRLVDGTYGICLYCEEEISAKRLNAVPWSPLCLDCQSRQDRRPLGSMDAGTDNPALDPAA